MRRSYPNGAGLARQIRQERRIQRKQERCKACPVRYGLRKALILLVKLSAALSILALALLGAAALAYPEPRNSLLETLIPICKDALPLLQGR